MNSEKSFFMHERACRILLSSTVFTGLSLSCETRNGADGAPPCDSLRISGLLRSFSCKREIVRLQASIVEFFCSTTRNITEHCCERNVDSVFHESHFNRNIATCISRRRTWSLFSCSCSCAIISASFSTDARKTCSRKFTSLFSEVGEVIPPGDLTRASSVASMCEIRFRQRSMHSFASDSCSLVRLTCSDSLVITGSNVV
mmetsp:Transcript_2688/g.5206  ORF Transcript_2688/g.5206 Transcript_2688/m.5206 type:complete len:201 (-) Transcript_2688:1640-2242(-)